MPQHSHRIPVLLCVTVFSYRLQTEGSESCESLVFGLGAVCCLQTSRNKGKRKASREATSISFRWQVFVNRSSLLTEGIFRAGMRVLFRRCSLSVVQRIWSVYAFCEKATLLCVKLEVGK